MKSNIKYIIIGLSIIIGLLGHGLIIRNPIIQNLDDNKVKHLSVSTVENTRSILENRFNTIEILKDDKLRLGSGQLSEYINGYYFIEKSGEIIINLGKKGESEKYGKSLLVYRNGQFIKLSME